MNKSKQINIRIGALINKYGPEKPCPSLLMVIALEDAKHQRNPLYFVILDEQMEPPRGEGNAFAKAAVQSISEEPDELRTHYMKTLDDIAKMAELIKQRMDQLDAKETNWNKLQRMMQENADLASEKVKLDVGGKTFCIAKSHLLSVEGSYFHAMLASGHWKPDSDGAYFIDRNPKHFDRVMEYLRTGELSFSGMHQDQIRTLLNTLDYLQLGPFYPPVVWDPEMCGKGISLSQGGRSASSKTKRRSVRSWHPCIRYSVRVNADGVNPCVMIGFAPTAGFEPDTATYKTCGWFMFAYDGKLWAQGSIRNVKYGKRISHGSVVTCIFDREKGTISYEVDGKSLGVAYFGLPKGEVHAALNFTSTLDIQLTLVG